jgi:uncharacterized membrane-anchored protein
MSLDDTKELHARYYMKNILYKEGLVASFMRSSMVVGGGLLALHSAYRTFFATPPLTGLWTTLGVAGTVLGLSMLAYGYYCYKRFDAARPKADNVLTTATYTPAPRV